MSFSQQNRRLNEEPEYRYAFLTTKNGNSTRRFRTCTFVNLQFSFSYLKKEARRLILRALIVQSMIGPCPRHEVVVMAVKKAVSAATMTFTATSMMRFFILYHWFKGSAPSAPRSSPPAASPS